MVHSYFKYENYKNLGIISSNSNAIFDLTGKNVICGGLEDVVQWCPRTVERVHEYKDADLKNTEVTCIIKKSDGCVCAGYADGSIRIWSKASSSPMIIFRGHKTAVLSLDLDPTECFMVSASKESEIVVWDIQGERGYAKLNGHKGSVTCVKFLNSSYLVSSSKDMMIKLWDLNIRECIETISDHQTEIYSLGFSLGCGYLFTGSKNKEIRVYKMSIEDLNSESMLPNRSIFSYYGSLNRHSTERCISIKVLGDYVFVLANCDVLEVFYIRPVADLAKRLARKKKRLREKEKDDSEATLTFNEQIEYLTLIKASGKLSSLDLFSDKSGAYKILLNRVDNAFEIHDFSVSLKSPEVKKTSVTIQKEIVLENLGHSNDIRFVSISSNDEMILSGSSESIRIWNSKSGQLIRSFSCDYPVSGIFAPGDRQVIIGFKSGCIILFDINTSVVLDEVDAHSGAIWTISLRPDRRGIMTASADKSVRFWDFEMIEDLEYSATARRISIALIRTLQVSDEVTCACYSPDQKYVLVCLLDCTVRIFFNDSLKFYLALYGHKLPVLSIDVSSDNALIVTGSSDKTVKIWGLDFGDCHRSIRAHSDSVCRVVFVPSTHYFFTCSKDKLIHYYDADRFERITKVFGHKREVWGLAMSKFGHFLVSGSNDRSIRIWERTTEPLFIEEQKEIELEEAFEKDESVTLTPKQTLIVGEKIMEALELAQMEEEKLNAYYQALKSNSNIKLPQKNPAISFYGDDTTLDEYVAKVFERLSLSDLEDGLMILSYAHCVHLLRIVGCWCEKQYNIQLTSRILNILLRVHAKQISISSQLKSLLTKIKEDLRRSAVSLRDDLGFNISGLKVTKMFWENEYEAHLFADDKIEEKLSSMKLGPSIKRKNIQ